MQPMPPSLSSGARSGVDHKVSPDLFARAKALFGPHTLIDLVLLMGNYAGTAALLSAVDMQLHAGKQPLLPIP
jgi:4-carboxymuconolactone decarboxylase